MCIREEYSERVIFIQESLPWVDKNQRAFFFEATKTRELVNTFTRNNIHN